MWFIFLILIATTANADPLLRPLDDSDPEMKVLMELFFTITPCGPPGQGICPDAAALLTGGGDRLANYLIRQHEANEREKYPNQVTYLRLLGHTESNVAVGYLMMLAVESKGSDRYITTIEGLGRTKNLRAMRTVLNATRHPDVAVQLTAVNAADRIQQRNGPQPEIMDRLAEMEKQSRHTFLTHRIQDIIKNPY